MSATHAFKSSLVILVLAAVRAQAAETTERLAELEAKLAKNRSNTAVAKPEN